MSNLTETFLEQIECYVKKVHFDLGSGLNVNLYKEYLHYLLYKAKIQVTVDEEYHLQIDDFVFKSALKADLKIEDKVVVMFVNDIAFTIGHYQQFKLLLKYSGIKFGFLLNFNSYVISNGIERFKVNGENSVVHSSTIKWSYL